MTAPIDKFTVEAQAVLDILQSIEPQLIGKDTYEVFVAAISLAITCLKPEIEPDQLVKSVNQVSEMIATVMGTMDDDGKVIIN